MNISDASEQIVAMQAQMLRNSMNMAITKSNAEQQREAVSMLTEATQSAAAAEQGRGTLLDILV